MYRNLLAITALTVLLPLIATSQTTVPGGDVNGIWELSGSPYNVEGEITIPSGDTLTIEPGVTVDFQGHYKFVVNGLLEAQGTEVDSILFTAADQDTGWHGLRFESATDSSHLSYCIIQYGLAEGTSPDNLGGGIYCDNSNPIITYCSIRENASDGAGGGIYCTGGSNPLISHSAVFGNNAVLDGGGIHCWDEANPTINHCTIFGNSGTFGGGIFCGSSSNPDITSCTVSGNTASQFGGGLNCYQAEPTILNTIIEGNFGTGGLNIYNSPGISISYCDLYNNAGGNFTGNSVPAGAGQLSTVNANGDSCDVYFNIFQNPLFEDPNNGIYQLTWIDFPTWNETRSPCVDAGNPDPQYFDADATIGDVGALYFDQSAFPPVPDLSVSSLELDFGVEVIGNQGEMELTVYNVGNSSLILYDVSSSSSVFSTDFNPLDSLILPTDSLLIMVYFNPDDTVSYSEILSIDNNDELVVIRLLGIGEAPPAPEISASADSLDFGEVLVSTQNSLPFTIYNVGDTTLVLYEITTGNEVFTTDFDPADSLILQGDSLIVTVTFEPTEITTYVDTLVIDNNDELLYLALLGEGIGPPEPQITLSADSLYFDPLLAGEQDSLSLVIYNIGDSTLVLYSIEISDSAFTTDFDLADSLIAPGDSLSVMVYFQPLQIGTYLETLTIENNDELATVVLQGEGLGPVQVTLTPYNPPIIVPEAGGSFDFNMVFENITGDPQTIDIWTQIFFPVVGSHQILTILDITLPPTTIDRDRTQVVPDFAPPGVYTYYAFVGDYPWVIEDYDSFTFEKLGVDGEGWFGSPSDWICTGEGFEDLSTHPNAEIPDEFALTGAYPNPFNPTTTISFTLPELVHVRVAIFNLQGRKVGELVNGMREAGWHGVTFDAKGLPTGVYFVHLTAGKFQQTQKLLLLK